MTTAFWAAGVVARVEVAARAQRDLHGLQVVLVHDARERRGILARGILDPLGARAPGPIAPEREDIAEADRLDARQRRDAADRAVEVLVGVGEAVEGARRIDPPGHGVLRLEAEIDLEQRAEAAEQQARADEQHAGERDLDDDERVARERGRSSGAALLRGVLLRAVPADRCQAGSTPQAIAGQPGEPDRDRERERIDRGVLQERHTERLQPGQRAGRPDRERDADQRARNREHADSRPAPAGRGGAGCAPRATRTANSCRRTLMRREQQVGEVDARDGEHARHRAGQHVEGRPEGAAQRVARAG